MAPPAAAANLQAGDRRAACCGVQMPYTFPFACSQMVAGISTVPNKQKIVMALPVHYMEIPLETSFYIS